MVNEKVPTSAVDKNKLIIATAIFVVPSLLIAIFQLLLAFSVYIPGMGIYDLTGGISAKYELVIILMYLLIIACFFPISIVFYKSHGVKLQNEFFADNKYFKDIALGVAAALVSFTVSFIIAHIIFKTPVYRYTSIAEASFFLISNKHLTINCCLPLIYICNHSGYINSLNFYVIFKFPSF